MWQRELEGDVSMAEARIREAAATGAGYLVTACPWCLVMLDDARKASGALYSDRRGGLNELILVTPEALAETMRGVFPNSAG